MLKEIEITQAIENKFGEKYYSEINNLTFEKLSSHSVFNKFYKEFVGMEEHVLIVAGSDSGLLFQYVKSHDLPKNLHFIFVEFDNVIAASDVLNQVDAESDANIRVVGPDFNFVQLESEFSSYVIRRKINLIKSLAVMDAKPGTPYYQLSEQLEVRFNAFRRSAYNGLSTRVFEEERILNAADNMTPVSVLAGDLEGKDAIIIGGGPTLDDSIDWIRANQSRFIVVAAARVAKRLAKESIEVDFFITVDPFPWSFDNSKSVLAFSESSILIHSFHAQHKLVSQWNGLSVYSGPKYGWFGEGRVENIQTPGPTVTNSALHIACSLGVKRAFLAGIDFCFAGGLTHESGSDEAKMSDTFGYNSKAKLVDNEGNLTETADDFYSAWQSMQNAIQIYKATKPIEFISLGLHSAKMKGVHYVPSDEIALDETDKASLIAMIKDKLYLSVAERKTNVENSLSELKVQLQRFTKLQKHAQEGLKTADKIYNGTTWQPNEKKMERIQKIRKKVDSLIGLDGDMLMNYQASFFSESFKPVEDETAMKPEEVVEQLEAFFGGVQKVAGDFIEILEKGIDRAKLRNDELNNKVLPSKLIDRWERWQEFGRSIQWQSWHQTSLPDAEQAVLEAAIQSFTDEYEKQDHYYISTVKAKINNVNTLFVRAKQASDSGNVSEIVDLIAHSESLEAKNDSQKHSFISLLKGMRDEMQGEYETAIKHYQQVEMPQFKHFALQRLLNHYMDQKNYEQSLPVLEQLCAVSTEYMIPYADILWLMEQHVPATQVLHLYLQQHPEQYAVQNKFAQFLMELGEREAALETVNMVLENEPNDKTAMHLQAQLMQA